MTDFYFSCLMFDVTVNFTSVAPRTGTLFLLLWLLGRVASHLHENEVIEARDISGRQLQIDLRET